MPAIFVTVMLPGAMLCHCADSISACAKDGSDGSIFIYPAQIPSMSCSANATGLTALIANYEALARDGVPLVLATVIETLGSTYRKAGARMLISADGRFHGLIGGGCFEGDLYEQARAVFETGEARLLFYDMRAPEDALWGLGLGCNGAVRLLLQPLATDGGDPTIALLQSILASDSPAVLATLCDGPEAGRSDWLPLAAADGEQPDEPFRAVMQHEACSVAALQQSALITHDHETGSGQIFYDWIRPPPRLLLIGAGADAVPIVALARQLDWHVVLADHRPAFAVAERFPAAEAVIQARPGELMTTLDGRRIDAVVLMTHNIEYDSRYLEVLRDLDCHYLGLLGPAARRERLLEMTGLDETALGTRLHGPVGLDIGGAAPESIALSLISEIHAVLHERDARPLCGKREPIQTRSPLN